MEEYRLHAVQRKIRRISENDGSFCQALETMCDKYCKYPDIYDEEKEGVSLSESDYCKNCTIGG